MNSDELLRINSLKPILLKFRLLEKLTIKGKNNFGYCMNPFLYYPEINQLLIHLNSLIIYKNKKSLKELVAYCLEHHQMLNVIETIFPYNKFNKECKGNDFEISFYYIKMMIELYKYKTNFILIFDKEQIPFIFGFIQYDRLFPILKLNEEKNIYLSKESCIKIYKPIKGKKELKGINLITSDEYVNKKTTIHFLKFITQNAGQIDPDNIKHILASFDGDDYDLVSEKKFLSSNLFLTNNSIIPKIWTLLYSFKPDSEVLNYLIENFIPSERDIFYIIKNNFYDCLTETYQIENDFEFTEKMNFFFNEQSFLWRYIIGKEIEEKLREEEYKNYENQIEKEISDFG